MTRTMFKKILQPLTHIYFLFKTFFLCTFIDRKKIKKITFWLFWHLPSWPWVTRVPWVAFPVEIINLDTVNYHKVNQSHIFKIRQFVCCVYFSHSTSVHAERRERTPVGLNILVGTVLIFSISFTGPKNMQGQIRFNIKMISTLFSTKVFTWRKMY